MSSKTNRTGADWLNDLLSSVRFKIALENFKHDPQFMLAILTEIMLETQEVTKLKLKRIFAKNHNANKAFIIEQFENNTDYSGFRRPWDLTPTEQKLYMADPHFQFTEKQRKQFLKTIQKSFMGSAD